MTLLLAISQKYVFYKYLGGAFFAPVLPRALLMLMEALYGALILLFFLLLLKDGVLLILWLGRRIGAIGHCSLPLTAIKVTMVRSPYPRVLGHLAVHTRARYPYH